MERKDDDSISSIAAISHSNSMMTEEKHIEESGSVRGTKGGDRRQIFNDSSEILDLKLRLSNDLEGAGSVSSFRYN